MKIFFYLYVTITQAKNLISMKQILLLAFLLFTLNTAHSQIPGYQGKRFFVEAGISFFPNLFAPTLEFNNSFSIKAYYSFSCNYVIGRKTIFRVGYTHQAAGLQMSYQYSYAYNKYYLFLHDANFAFDLYGKKKGNLAPLGFYFSPGIRFVFSKEEPVNKPVSASYTSSPVVMFGLTTKLGYRAILFNRVTLNMGFEFTFFPQYLLLIHPAVPLSVPGYEREVIRITADRYLFGIHIGIGVLLF